MMSVLTKLMPTVVSKIGWKGALELLLGASLGAEVLNLGVDKIKELISGEIHDKATAKQQELLKKRAALLEQKAKEAEAAVKEVEQQKEEVVEEKPEKANKNKKKSK